MAVPNELKPELAGIAGRPVRCIFFHIQVDKGLEARPLHVGAGARQDHLEAAWRGMIATAVHDPAAVDTGNPGGADAVVAVGRGLGVHLTCGQGQHKGQQGGSETGCQAVKGGGGAVSVSWSLSLWRVCQVATRPTWQIDQWGEGTADRAGWQGHFRRRHIGSGVLETPKESTVCHPLPWDISTKIAL